MKHTLNKLFAQEYLSHKEAYTILTEIGTGKYSDIEIAAFVTTFRMRSISPTELGGFRAALLDLCTKVDLQGRITADLCGTGGDGKDTFNISTLASFIVAGTGNLVAKHGNYGVSSGCGSSNVLEYLGYKFTNNIDTIRKSIDQAGITVLHAPLFHPAMKYAAPARRTLGIKTFFNMLGPMINPAFPTYKITGVYNLETQRLYGFLYQDTEEHFSIIHSLDGYDEVSLTSDFKLITSQSEDILSPSYFGFEKLKQEQLHGGQTVESGAKIFMTILKGEGNTAQNNAVVANAALALQCIDSSKAIDICVEQAQNSLLSGKALKAFERLIEIN